MRICCVIDQCVSHFIYLTSLQCRLDFGNLILSFFQFKGLANFNFKQFFIQTFHVFHPLVSAIKEITYYMNSIFVIFSIHDNWNYLLISLRNLLKFRIQFTLQPFKEHNLLKLIKAYLLIFRLPIRHGRLLMFDVIASSSIHLLMNISFHSKIRRIGHISSLIANIEI